MMANNVFKEEYSNTSLLIQLFLVVLININVSSAMSVLNVTLTSQYHDIMICASVVFIHCKSLSKHITSNSNW